MSQSLNRYSYAMNNPMSYTDPSGFNWDSGGPDDPFGPTPGRDWGGPSDTPSPTYGCDLLGRCFTPRMPGDGPNPADDPSQIPAPGPVYTENGTLVELDGVPPSPPSATPAGDTSGRAAEHVGRRDRSGRAAQWRVGQQSSRQRRGRATPETRRSTVETAAEWLRSQGMIDFEDRYVHVIKNPTGDRIIDCGSDPACGIHQSVTGGITQGQEVTIFRGGVEPWLLPETISVSNPARIDPSRQVWGERWSQDIQSSLEHAIFVIGHEDWHVRNPPRGNPDPAKDQIDEWEANERGRRFLERWRNRKR